MYDVFSETKKETAKSGVSLRSLKKGMVATVSGFRTVLDHHVDLADRLRDMGFDEGSRVQILHTGLIGGEPIAVAVDELVIALRKTEADLVLIDMVETAA